MIKCPYCNNISEDEKTCSHCGESLITQCHYCKKQISVNDKVCPFCNRKLSTSPISILIKATYFLIFLNAMIPYWLANSINKHPVFWHKMVEKNDDVYSLIALAYLIALISAVPAATGLVLNYRKRICIISIITLIFLCICTTCLILKIQ